ncbi:hypothetical protein [Mycoplasma hafezii]|uniref:hypothetical protein n=1 Tax=Mycoplasma hafezii TaxID=525886 RepID=UPI003CF83F01
MKKRIKRRMKKTAFIGVPTAIAAATTIWTLSLHEEAKKVITNPELIDLMSQINQIRESNKDRLKNYSDNSELDNILTNAQSLINSDDSKRVNELIKNLKEHKNKLEEFLNSKSKLEQLDKDAKKISVEKVPSSISKQLTLEIENSDNQLVKNSVTINELNTQYDNLNEAIKTAEQFIQERAKLEKEWAELQLQTVTGMNKRYQEVLKQARVNVENVINNKESSLEEIKQAIDEYKIKLSDAITNADLIQQARKAKKDKEAEIANYPQITFEQIVQNYNNLDNVAKPAFDDYESNEDLLKDIKNIKNYEIVVSKPDDSKPNDDKNKTDVSQPKAETKPNENTGSTDNNQTAEETKPSNENEQPKDDNVDNKPTPEPEKPKDSPVVADAKKVINAVELILKDYDIPNSDEINKILTDLNDLINEPKQNIQKISETKHKLFEKAQEFADSFNNAVETTTTNFYKGFKNFRLYDDNLATGNVVSSFVQVPLLGWNDIRNKEITDQLKEISKKYLTNNEQLDTLNAQNDAQFNSAVEEAYKINLNDLDNPKIPGVNKKSVNEKYLSVIYESAQLLRTWILKTFDEWWQWLQIAKEYLTPTQYIEMLVKTTGYGLENLEYSELKNKQSEYFDPNERNFEMPDEYAFKVEPNNSNLNQKELFADNASVSNWGLLWDSAIALLSENPMGYSIYPFIWGAQQFGDITNWDNSGIKPDKSSIYSKSLTLDEFLKNKKYYEVFLNNKTPWYGEPIKLGSRTNDLINVEEDGSKFTFDFMTNPLNYSYTYSQTVGFENFSYVFRELFNERVELFNQNLKADVENYSSMLQKLKNLIHKEVQQGNNSFVNVATIIDKATDIQSFDQNTMNLIEKYNYYKNELLNTKDQLTEKAYPILKEYVEQKIQDSNTEEAEKQQLQNALDESEAHFQEDDLNKKVEAISVLLNVLKI